MLYLCFHSCQFISHIRTLKPIEVNDNDSATIELDMDLLDPSSKIYLYKVRHEPCFVFLHQYI